MGMAPLTSNVVFWRSDFCQCSLPDKLFAAQRGQLLCGHSVVDGLLCNSDKCLPGGQNDHESGMASLTVYRESVKVERGSNFIDLIPKKSIKVGHDVAGL